MDITQYAELAAVYSLVVMTLIGGLKSGLPKLRSIYTVLAAGALSYLLAFMHAFASGRGCAAVEQGLIVGSLAWAGSLGVSYATRLKPTACAPVKE
jgi:hypothetical protein